jgi:transcriptional regulator with XRE-family HTH domain
VDETFGQMVRRLRKARRWTQEKLGEVAVLDQSTISAIEKDKGERTVGTVTKLAEAFGAEPLEWLVLAGLVRSAEVPAPSLLPPADRVFDVDQIVRFVESKPDDDFLAALARQRDRRKRESYQRLCVRIYRAWTSNADMVMGELAEVEL